MEEAIEAKNSILRNLKYSLAHATKAYNDAIRVYEAKLVEFGIPAEELGLELLETNTSNMPAGLVAAWYKSSRCFIACLGWNKHHHSLSSYIYYYSILINCYKYLFLYLTCDY